MSTDQNKVPQTITEKDMDIEEFLLFASGAGATVFSNANKKFRELVTNVSFTKISSPQWVASSLSNDSFYLYPKAGQDLPENIEMAFANNYTCCVSHKVAGIIITLCVLDEMLKSWSQLMQNSNDEMQSRIALQYSVEADKLYYALRAFVREHEQSFEILSAIN